MMPWVLTGTTVAGNRTIAIRLDRVAALAHDDRHLLVDLGGDMNSCLALKVDPKPGPGTKERLLDAIAGFAEVVGNDWPGRGDHKITLEDLIGLGQRMGAALPFRIHPLGLGDRP